MHVIVKVDLPSLLDNIQFSFHDNESSTLQLINGISNDLQKLLKYFSGTAIYTLFLSVIKLDLYLYDDKLLTAKSTFPSISSLLNCHKLPKVSE